MPPLHDIAHLAHVELRSAHPERTVDFFTGYLGLSITTGTAAPG